MKSFKTDIPSDSLTRQYLPVNYTDAFACKVTGAKKLSTDELMINFWAVMPGWVDALFKLRNILVRPFGLKNGDNSNYSEGVKEMIRTGSGNSGIMSVIAKSEKETVVLLSDKHLDAYMSVHISENGELQTTTVVTLVHYHNNLGRFYFFFIRPFHTIVMKSMLKSTLKRMLKVNK